MNPKTKPRRKPPNGTPLVATGYSDPIKEIGDQIAVFSLRQLAELSRVLRDKYGLAFNFVAL